jgi:hypothetical protein
MIPLYRFDEKEGRWVFADYGVTSQIKNYRKLGLYTSDVIEQPKAA